MKTDELITLLAADSGPVVRRAAFRHLAMGAAVGVALAAVLMQLSHGVRPDLAQAIVQPMFWMKLLFPAAVALASLATLARLARPGVDARGSALAIAAPILLLWLMALAAYVNAPPPQRASMLWGQTWHTCAASIVLIATPIVVATLLALRQLAPTRLALAGGCAGLLGGAAGASVYALHCPESALPFVAVWYVAGIVLSALAGAALGPRVLRW